MLPNVFGLCALALDIYVRIALSRFEQWWCVKSESHLYILCNYLPFSKAAKGAQGGPQQHKTPKQKHSPTDISKRLRSSQNNMDCIYMTPLHCPFALSLFWWLEPLGNVSGWASMFKSLGPSSTTFEPLAAFRGEGQIIAHFLWRSYNLHIYYGIFCTGCSVCGQQRPISPQVWTKAWHSITFNAASVLFWVPWWYKYLW